MATEKNISPANDHWESRTLCSDESCIGVIGPDGRCRECGRPYEGELPASPDASQAQEAAASAPEIEPADATDAPMAPPPRKPEDRDAAESDWESRTLCSDESCIGVIGPDGRCKECGKPFAES